MDAKATGEAPRYWSFICYAPEDEPWANWLHQELEGFCFPGILKGQPAPYGPVPKRLHPVFIGRTDGQQTAGNTKQVERALQESRSLIVICSSSAVASPSVDHQLRYFKSLGREDRVLGVIRDASTGEPSAEDSPQTQLIPKAARFKVNPQQQVTDTPAALIVADSRPQYLGRKDTVIKLVAGILGFDYADLDRDISRERERWRIIFLSSSVLLLVLCTLITQVYVWKHHAEQARIEAERQREAAQKADMRARQARDHAITARKQAAERLKSQK